LQSPSALGVQFDLGGLPLSASSVSNKPARVSKVVSELDAVLAVGKISFHDAESVRGKLQYMGGQIFGNVGKGMLSLLSRCHKTVNEVSEELREAIVWLRSWIADASPRKISPAYQGQPLLLFTDGACEFAEGNRLVTCGAILFDPRDSTAHCFGVQIVGPILDEWSRGGKSQLVTEAELLPLLLARLVWHDRLADVLSLNFVDSEPAKHSCVRGTSESPACADIVRAIHMQENKLQSWTWYSRLPSFSNPADGPSRLDFKQAEEVFLAKRWDVRLPKSLLGGRWLEF